jgi:hypothetical protein
MWVFLLGDMVIFGILFATFMSERSRDAAVFDASRKTLHAGIGLTNTLVLLTSSLLVVAAVAAMRADATSRVDVRARCTSARSRLHHPEGHGVFARRHLGGQSCLVCIYGHERRVGGAMIEGMEIS